MENLVITFLNNRINQVSLSLLALFLVACSPGTKTKTEDEKVFTYNDIYELVIQGTGEGIEWHEEPTENQLHEFLSITNEGSCGDADCGKSLYLNNNGDQKLEVIVKAPFQIGDVTSYLSTQYQLEPSSKTAIGCSHLCHEGESFLFERKIVLVKAL